MENMKSSSSSGNGHAPLSGSSGNADENLQPTAYRAVERFASGAHQAVDKLAGSANRAAQTLEVKSGQVKDVQEQMTEELRNYVRDNPLTSLGIGIATGFLLSRLINL